MSRATSGGDALFRRWTGKLFSRRNFLKVYGLAIIGLISTVLVYVYRSEPFYYQSIEYRILRFWIIGNFFLIYAARLQIVVLSGMIILRDLSGTFWELVRSTPVTHDDINYSLLKYYFIIPIASMIILVYLESGTMSFVHLVINDGIFSLNTSIFVIIGLAGYGAIMTGFSLIGGLLTGKPIGLVIGALVTVILLIMAGGSLFVFKNTGISITDSFLGTLVDILMLTSFPETYYSQLSRISVASGPSGQEYTVGALALIMVAMAVVVWLCANVVVLRKRG